MGELNLILMGPPGAGKGTQAQRLVEDFDLPYYATGDILRAAVKEETDLGKEAKQYMDRGDLVPDELICKVIMERVDSPAAADGFLLDGFPRTIGQAETLEGALERRGLIERAKGILMKRHRWSEADAFRRLQRGAMNRRVPMIELAQAVLNGQQIDL